MPAPVMAAITFGPILKWLLKLLGWTALWAFLGYTLFIEVLAEC